MDPQERVAKSHEKPSNDIMATWSVSEIDKKGRKKKGKLGIANGFVFFASESDKTPVRQWPSTSVTVTHTDKPKHVIMDVGGPSRESLHFSAGSKDVAEDIVAKLGSSRVATDSVADAAEEPSHAPLPTERKAVKVKKSVNFSSGPVEVIGSTDDDVEIPPSGEVIGVVLYDFVADGDDELAVTDGEHVVVLDRESSADWWRVRNQRGHEGVVPALYVQVNEDGVSVAGQQSQHDESLSQPAQEEFAPPKARAEEERKRVEAEVQREAAELAKAAASEQARKRTAEQKAVEKERLGRETRREAERQRREEVESARAEVSRKREPNSKPSKDKTRIWHDRTGQFRVEAEYLGMRDGKLSLHKTNGVIIEVPAEKMSPADITYVESLDKRKNESTPDDEIPLAQLPAATNRVSAPKSTPTPKRPNVDWFAFFLNAGCDVDDCTRYASAFERDKIDEAILPDLEGPTLRTLGLREGDIIRVTKFIKQRTRSASSDTKASDDAVQEQIKKDEELARRLQSDMPTPQRTSSTSPAPNLFSGANGALKNQRRGRRALEPKASSTTVDVVAIENATAQIRVGTPQTPVRSPEIVTPGPPARKSTAPINGFEDDAWAPRPSSTAGVKSNKPALAVASPPLPAPTPPQAPQPPPVTALPLNSSTGQSTQRPSSTTPSGSSSQFDLLAQIRQMRPPSAPILGSPAGAQSSPVPSGSISPPVGYSAGFGASHSPSPIGQLLTAQQTGALPPPQPPNGLRGPFAPIPQNQGLLSPLVPTNSNINNNFIPTRPLQSQSTGFPQNNLITPQITGVPLNFQRPLQAQPTGLSNSFGGFGPTPTGGGLAFNNPSGFQNGLQPQPQQQTSFDTFANSGPAPPPPGNNTSPASVFASMKAGTFGNNSVPQSSDKYDALRSPNGAGAPSFLPPQPTGWGGGAQVNFSLQPQPTGFQLNQFDPNGLQAQPTGFHGGFQQSQFGGFR